MKTLWPETPIGESPCRFLISRRGSHTGNIVFRPDLIELSIRTLDRSARHDWRHFQRIKNELVSPEAEFVEIYPNENRLVDTANQYYLFGVEDWRVPFGFDTRLVSETTEARQTASGKQRPFGVYDKPYDLKIITQQMIDELITKRAERVEEA
jgi:hypothetical protein